MSETYDELRSLDEPQENVLRAESAVPCELLVGRAGTGKTFEILRRVREDESYGLLTATTGISAVNLGTVTLNSTLRYFDTAAMRDLYLSGGLARTLHQIAREYRRIIVEEVSMLDAGQLDLLYRGVAEANRYSDVREPLGILLVGDFGQLPPVKGRWAFESEVWPEFAAHETRLAHVWRQDSGPFLDALDAARRGDGRLAADILASAGAHWHTQLDPDFEGTTILPDNKMVNRYNALGLARIPGPALHVASRRWGQQRAEWGKSRRTHEWGIPPQFAYKLGAYVTIKSNASDFSVVNGDCGHIVEYTPPTHEYAADDYFTVRVLRTGRDERVGRIVRSVEVADAPVEWNSVDRVPRSEDAGGWVDYVHYRGRTRRYVTGQIEYFPLALAYASTVHRSQSLTLDRVQCDYRGWFFGQPAMLYTALSRARTLQGLRLVGSADRFRAQCQADVRVRRWL